MLRIISGKHRGRKVETKENAKIRPTGSRARGAIFNMLMHGEFRGLGRSPIVGGRVLDLFCGTGALGLEAFSRGAEHVTFVDQSAESMSLARANVAAFGETKNSQFLRNDSTSLPPTATPYTLAFLDPPYHSGLALKSLASMHKQGWLLPGAIVVTEMDAREKFAAPEHYTAFNEREYGNTKIVFLRYL